MDDFPGNSNRSKEEASRRAVTAPEEKKEERVQRVVTGKVTRRKKPLSEKIKEVFLGGESQGVLEYVLKNVLVPAAKDMAQQAFTQLIERTIYPNGDGPRGGSSSRRREGRSYEEYGSRYSGAPRREERRETRGYQVDEIVVPTRREADAVLEGLEQKLEDYGSASVGDLNDLLGETGEYTDENWGWRDLYGSKVRFLNNEGYLIILPKPESLKPSRR